MAKFFLLPLLIVAAYAQEDNGRFLFKPVVGVQVAKTIFEWKVSTATTTVTNTPFCYTIAPLVSMPTVATTLTTSIAAPLNCRRRRWAFENPADGELGGMLAGNPAAASIQPSDLPEMRSSDNHEETESFDLVASIADPKENDARVTRSADAAQERFLAIVTTVKTTLTVFSTETSNAATKTFTLGCTPQGASFAKC